ncbi:TPA: hypothetical protein ACGOTT_000640 [Streptococcus suis]|nr:hypothetical protein [Streptococcus suis]
MKNIDQTTLEEISGGGNIVDCAYGIGGSALAIVAGPAGWAGLLAAGVAGFKLGYACTSLYLHGD